VRYKSLVRYGRKGSTTVSAFRSIEFEQEKSTLSEGVAKLQSKCPRRSSPLLSPSIFNPSTCTLHDTLLSILLEYPSLNRRFPSLPSIVTPTSNRFFILSLSPSTLPLHFATMASDGPKKKAHKERLSTCSYCPMVSSFSCPSKRGPPENSSAYPPLFARSLSLSVVDFQEA